MYKPQKAGNSSRYKHSIGNTVILSEEKSGRFVSGLPLGSEIKSGEERVRGLKIFVVNNNSVWFKIYVHSVSPKCENKIANRNL